MKPSRLFAAKIVLAAFLGLPVIAATGCAAQNTTPYQQTASQTVVDDAASDVFAQPAGNNNPAPAVAQDDQVYDQNGNLRPFTKPYTNASQTPPTGAGGNYGWWF